MPYCDVAIVSIPYCDDAIATGRYDVVPGLGMSCLHSQSRYEVYSHSNAPKGPVSDDTCQHTPSGRTCTVNTRNWSLNVHPGVHGLPTASMC